MRYGWQVFIYDFILLFCILFDIFYLAALEARVAGSYFSTHKPKRHMQKTLSFFRQISLTKSTI